MSFKLPTRLSGERTFIRCLYVCIPSNKVRAREIYIFIKKFSVFCTSILICLFIESRFFVAVGLTLKALKVPLTIKKS